MAAADATSRALRAEAEEMGIGAVAGLLGIPRLRIWWWSLTRQFVSPVARYDGYRLWARSQVWGWALAHARADRVPLRYWPRPARPASYGGTTMLTGAVAQLWHGVPGSVVVIWPLPGVARPPTEVWVAELNRATGPTRPTGSHGRIGEADAPIKPAAIVVVTPRFDGTGPELDDLILGRESGTNWADLSRAITGPVPFWATCLRDPDVLRTWQPPRPDPDTEDAEDGTDTVGADTVDVDTVDVDRGSVVAGRASSVVAAVADIDVAALLQLAATFGADQPAHQVLTNLAQVAAHRATSTARQVIRSAEETVARRGRDTLLVAARPMPVPAAETDDVDAVIRRLGWLDVAARTDTLAARCIREVSRWDAGRDLPFGSPEQITGETPAAREWLRRLEPATRTAAFELLPAPAGQYLIDPATNAPAVRDIDGAVHATMPRWLPATSQLAEVILDTPIWVRTADDVIWPAPQHPDYGLSFGYDGTGPATLAALIHTLLDDINAPAPETATGAPPGLERLTSTPMPRGTVLTRHQLTSARGGLLRPRLVFDATNDATNDTGDGSGAESGADDDPDDGQDDERNGDGGRR